MQKIITGVATAGVAALVLIAAKPAQRMPGHHGAACTATVSGTVTIGSSPAVVQATTSDSLAGKVTGSFPASSKLTVDSVWQAESSKSFNVSVNASQGVAGKYTLTLTSGAMSCSGDVSVIGGI